MKRQQDNSQPKRAVHAAPRLLLGGDREPFYCFYAEGNKKPDAGDHNRWNRRKKAPHARSRNVPENQIAV